MSQGPYDNNQPSSPVPPYGYEAAPGYGQAQGPQAPYGAGAPQQPTPPQAPVPPQQPQKRRGWIVALVAVAALFVVMMFGIWSCSSVFNDAAGDAVSDADMLTGDAVGVITIDGDIQYDGTVCSPEGLKEQLDIAADNDNIKAVVLRVNSGGGVATAGEEMTEYVKRFKEDTGKPVVVSSAATNASAAYEISSQADYIFTAKTTSIGAIGTAMQLMDYSELLEMLGISVEDITSAESKDSTYGTRALTDEERAYYQAQIDQINDTFIQNVADGRGMSVEEVEKLATGLTFTGVDAVDNGLADEIGTKEDAIDYAAGLAGLSYYETCDLQQYYSSDLSTLLDLMSESGDVSVSDVANALESLEEDGSLAK